MVLSSVCIFLLISYPNHHNFQLRKAADNTVRSFLYFKALGYDFSLIHIFILIDNGFSTPDYPNPVHSHLCHNTI